MDKSPLRMKSIPGRGSGSTGKLRAYWSKTRRIIYEYLSRADTQSVPTDEALLEQAHRELMDAHNQFAGAGEPELIDCAIYSLKAAEIKYDYLYKKIKQKRLARC